VRIKENEVTANLNVVINADKYEQTSFNYEEGAQFDKETEDIITQKMMNLIILETLKVKK